MSCWQRPPPTLSLCTDGTVYSAEISRSPSAQNRRPAGCAAGRRVGHHAEHRAFFRQPPYLEIRRGPATRQCFQCLFHARQQPTDLPPVFCLRLAAGGDGAEWKMVCAAGEKFSAAAGCCQMKHFTVSVIEMTNDECQMAWMRPFVIRHSSFA